MTDFRELCVELVNELHGYKVAHPNHDTDLIDRARAALAEPEPQRRCIYSPVQIAECGGPCEQGPEYCDCGELCVTEPASLEQGVQQMQPFVVRHYIEDERPTIKGNGFDGLEIGEDREEAEAFVAWINERLACLGQ